MDWHLINASEDYGEKVSEAILREVERIKPKAIFLPAGNTPIALYQCWSRNPPKVLDPCVLVQVDDIITGPKSGIFKKFFQAQLPAFTSQFEWIENQSEPRNPAPEITVLGLGPNGHLAFHEPHLPGEFSFGEVSLSPVTLAQQGLTENTRAKTYGIGEFSKSKVIFLLIRGAGKAPIVRKWLNRDPQVPAVAILDHEGLRVFVDQELADALGPL